MNSVIQSTMIRVNYGTNSVILLSIIFCFALSGCQLFMEPITSEKTPYQKHPDYGYLTETSTANFGQYYLDLHALTDNTLLAEAKEQEAAAKLGDINAGIYLILLYSLPNSPIQNVYKAKSTLNDQLKMHPGYQFSQGDHAFIILLKDQLNQQLYLLQKLINYELSQSQHVKLTNDLNIKINRLTEKITQLKKIEQAISEHGQ